MNESNPAVGRRTILRGAAITGAAVVAGPALAACGADEPTAVGTAETTAGPTPSDSGGDGSGVSGNGAGVLVTTADVPEGGGIILPDQEVVVTQPTAGEYVAFSTICTHQGCPVDAVENGTINCPCHGSMFAIADGAVVAGPAPSPLAPVEVTVDGTDVVRA